MQGKSRLDRELLDAGEMAGHLVPPGSVFAFLAEHRRELFPDSFIADLFQSRTGRPSLPADLVGSVLVLKELFDLSDPQTADALSYDIRWKVACGRSLDQMGFDPSTLVYWRRRIAASDRPDRVFDAVAEVITQTGILRGRRKRCVDSTVFDDAVETQDTVTQLVAAVRKVARVVPGAGEVIVRVCTLDYSQPGKPGIDWDDPAAKERLVSDLVDDALAVLAELAGPGAPQRDPDRGHPGPAYPQVQVETAGRVPRACGRRAGDRAGHRVRDDHGRRGRQHRCGERGDDDRSRPVHRRARQRRARPRAGCARGYHGQREPGR